MDTIPRQLDKIYADYEAAVSSGKSGFDCLLQGLSGLINDTQEPEEFYKSGSDIITVNPCPGVKFSYSRKLCLIAKTITHT